MLNSIPHTSNAELSTEDHLCGLDVCRGVRVLLFHFVNVSIIKPRETLIYQKLSKPTSRPTGSSFYDHHCIQPKLFPICCKHAKWMAEKNGSSTCLVHVAANKKCRIFFTRTIHWIAIPISRSFGYFPSK